MKKSIIALSVVVLTSVISSASTEIISKNDNRKILAVAPIELFLNSVKSMEYDGVHSSNFNIMRNEFSLAFGKPVQGLRTILSNQSDLVEGMMTFRANVLCVSQGYKHASGMQIDWLAKDSEVTEVVQTVEERFLRRDLVYFTEKPTILKVKNADPYSQFARYYEGAISIGVFSSVKCD